MDISYVNKLTELKSFDSVQYTDRLIIDDYQKWTRSTAIYPKDKAIEYTTLGLCSEVGEVCSIIKKVIRDNNGEFTDDVKNKLGAELGDVLYYLARLADEFGFKTSHIMEYNLLKLE
jgi:NTP pyrophosphatase (non-canonical NTP hydrolase)